MVVRTLSELLKVFQEPKEDSAEEILNTLKAEKYKKEIEDLFDPKDGAVYEDEDPEIVEDDISADW